MRCGNCKGDHPNADAIRECYRGKYARKQEEPDGNVTQRICDTGDEESKAAVALDKMSGDSKRPSAPDEPMWPASDAQIDYVIGLQDERELPANWTTYSREQLRRMERQDVSGAITALKALPRKEGHAGRRKWTMPAGRYALLNKHGVVSFYEVTHGKPNTRWDGYTFVKRLVGAPGSYGKLPMNKSLVDAVLRDIEDDPQEAAIRFGKESGTCSMCGSPLTHPDSLAAGIGPVCRGKVGW